MRNGETPNSRSRWRAVLWVVCLGLVACLSPPSPPSPSQSAFLVAALGDSYASGQGAPNEIWKCWKFWSTPSWDDKRCNRSFNAPTARAVETLQGQGHDVGYVSFACSGAKIEEGLIGPYDGSEPPSGPHNPLPSQVSELASLHASEGVDAVTVSVGGNDILFDFIVLVCAFGPKCNESPAVKAIVDSRLAQLPGRLDLLAQHLTKALIDPVLDPERILILEYLDPTQNMGGTPCDRKPQGDLLAGIDEDEAKWAADYIRPQLNDAIEAAATRHGWTYVPAIGTGFQKHGWCAQPENWINTINESTRRQRHPRGGMHPNREGHGNLGDRLAGAIAGLL